jgi:N-acetylglucosaminyldiphosphoundecaprenol N-acetyl-beta-D-mannosaminyltransferase
MAQESRSPGADAAPRRVPVGAVEVMALSERAVAEHVCARWALGEGGSIVTANVDIVRAATRDPGLAALVRRAEVVVADGMPVVWAARLAGEPVPERVTGASLVFTLAGAAAREGRSVYLLGGEPGVPDRAGLALAERFPGLRIAGADSPPFGFDATDEGVRAVVERVVAAEPGLVLVGLGFPRQERLIERLRREVPLAWYLGCGAGIPMAAGDFRRAPSAVQRAGAEWAHRLLLEPRRLARRYLLHDAPFALRLLGGALRRRLTTARTTGLRES